MARNGLDRGFERGILGFWCWFGVNLGGFGWVLGRGRECGHLGVGPAKPCPFPDRLNAIAELAAAKVKHCFASEVHVGRYSAKPDVSREGPFYPGPVR